MKRIYALSRTVWLPASEHNERGFYITDAELEGLSAGTHWIGADMKSVVVRSAESIKIAANRQRIELLKSYLTETDYKSHKHADGAMTAEEFAPVAAQRQLWRDEINALEREIEELRAAGGEE